MPIRALDSSWVAFARKRDGGGNGNTSHVRVHNALEIFRRDISEPEGTMYEFLRAA